jgi:hypothetical protein
MKFNTATFAPQKLTAFLLLKLVEKEDTMFNARPEYWEKHFAVYGDHISMCKFPSSEDVTCETVLKTIGLNTYLAMRMYPVSEITSRAKFRF